MKIYSYFFEKFFFIVFRVFLSGFVCSYSKLVFVGMDGINEEILQPLSPLNSEIYAEYYIDGTKLESFNAVDFWIPRTSEDHLEWTVRMTTSLLALITPVDNCTAVLSTVCALQVTFFNRLQNGAGKSLT